MRKRCTTKERDQAFILGFLIGVLLMLIIL